MTGDKQRVFVTIEVTCKKCSDYYQRPVYMQTEDDTDDKGNTEFKCPECGSGVSVETSVGN